MKKVFAVSLASILFFALFPSRLNSQDEEFAKYCAEDLKAPFINTGQPMKAFLTGDEVAEFHTTLYDGNVYRIITCSKQQENIQFSVYDKNRNLIFSNQEYNLVNFWDFRMEGSMECIIEARLNPKKATSGIALLMIGFKGYLKN
jgi:hypothetical protein